MLVGYMRVSSADDRQTVDLQRDALVAAGVDPRNLHTDKASGARDGSVAKIGGSQRRSEEHTSELQSLMRISYAVFCSKKNKTTTIIYTTHSRIIKSHKQHKTVL